MFCLLFTRTFVQPEPEINNGIKMEVGIEDCLHIEFEYSKSKYVSVCVFFCLFFCAVCNSVLCVTFVCTYLFFVSYVSMYYVSVCVCYVILFHNVCIHVRSNDHNININ